MERVTLPVAGIDEHLMSHAAAGDFAAFQELTARFQSRVFRVALRIVGQQQDAEDVTQQTFLSLIEHADSFRGESSVATWILRIATNHALKVLRKRRGLPTVAWDESADEDSYSTLQYPPGAVVSIRLGKSPGYMQLSETKRISLSGFYLLIRKNGHEATA